MTRRGYFVAPQEQDLVYRELSQPIALSIITWVLRNDTMLETISDEVASL
jgi:hypothetical protein